jgi:predicted Zn-dependent protease
MPAPIIPCPVPFASRDRSPSELLLELAHQALDRVMANAYRLYQAGKHVDVDVLCRGLFTVDPEYWWVYSLHAAALCRLGRHQEAVEQLDRGLTFDPGATKLRVMRGQILALLASSTETAARAEPPASIGHGEAVLGAPSGPSCSTSAGG